MNERTANEIDDLIGHVRKHLSLLTEAEAEVRGALELEGVRPRVISDECERDLVEFMRFRHFRRYDFGSACDWDRLDELTGFIYDDIDLIPRLIAPGIQQWLARPE